MSRTALTYQDYAALPDDGQRYQVIDGELCVTPAPGTRHQAIIMRLASLLHVHVQSYNLGEVFPAPTDVILREGPDDTSIVQPDIVFIERDRLTRISARGVEGAPTLAVEVLSPSTTTLDARRKRELYARHGVPYYWIVDGDTRTIEMLRLIAGAYEPLAQTSGDRMIAAEPFAGLLLTGVWP